LVVPRAIRSHLKTLDSNKYSTVSLPVAIQLREDGAKRGTIKRSISRVFAFDMFQFERFDDALKRENVENLSYDWCTAQAEKILCNRMP